MFEGFVDEAIELGPVRLRVRHALGPQPDTAATVLLLHGHPRTSATWHRVAGALRELG